MGGYPPPPSPPPFRALGYHTQFRGLVGDLVNLTWLGIGGGGVCTPYNGLYGEAPPERGTFFRLQEYKRVGISQI